MIVLDTNVVSELVHPAPDANVTRWMNTRRRSELRLTAVTVGELSYGVARLPVGRRRDALAYRLDALIEERFAERVLSLDAPAARRYGPVVVIRNQLGRPIDTPDAQIAAICLHHGAALATRNTRDFGGLGLTLIDPWEEG